jgi:hypothetical protein
LEDMMDGVMRGDGRKTFDDSGDAMSVLPSAAPERRYAKRAAELFSIDEWGSESGFKRSDSPHEWPNISIWGATRPTYDGRCPVCGNTVDSRFGGRQHQPGCDYMRKRAIGMGLALGGPALVGTALLSGVGTAVALGVILVIGLWWLVRHANAAKSGPPEER